MTDPDAWSIDLRTWCNYDDLAGREQPSDDPVLHTDVIAADVPAGFVQVESEVRQRLTGGPGFVVVRGFPVAGAGRRRVTQLYAWLMSRFGRFVPQNTRSDELHLVQTQGLGADRQYGSRGSGELLFHTDQAAAPPELLPAVLGLLTLDRAAGGGHTQLASAHALINGLLDRDPSLVTALTRPAPFGRADEGVSDADPVVAPILQCDATGRASLRYNRFFTEVGARQTGRVLADDLVAAFDAADEILSRPGLPHQLLLSPGDALIADNGLVLHNRSAYEDDQLHQRCLVRAWVR